MMKSQNPIAKKTQRHRSVVVITSSPVGISGVTSWGNREVDHNFLESYFVTKLHESALLAAFLPPMGK